MRILQAIIVIFAIIGCLALALGGFYIYTSSQGGGENFLTKLRGLKEAQTTATVATPAATPAAKSDYASVIQDYQPTPVPTPAGAVAGAPVAAAGLPGGVAPVATPVPVKTPAPTEGKIRNWPTGRKMVALTYDDGPHPDWTPKMIELLRSKNVKATFFLLGQNIERHPDIAKAVADNGFEIGNHTFSHPNFNTRDMTIPKIKDELVKTGDLIQQYVTPLKIQNMRPPFGNTGPKKLEPVCEELGLNIVCWDIDTDDWRSNVDATKMADNVMKNLKDGSIILMHDKHQKTYDCTAQIIDQIRAQGYQFVTVAELFGQATAAAPASAQQAAAPVAVQPQAAPAAVTPMLNNALPVPQAAQPGAVPAAPQGALPVPGAAVPAVQVSTPAPTGLDASKITQPPPR